MPGPSSPETKKKKNKAKEKAVVRNFNLKRGYKPAEDSIVRRMPHELTGEMKEWWDPFGGMAFHKSKGSKGGQNGAMAWIRRKYVMEFWDVFFPNAKDASDQDRAWFFKVSRQGKNIWAHFNNPLRGVIKNEGGEVKARKRAIPHDVYRREEPEDYNLAVEKWTEEHGSEPGVADRRKLSYDVFKYLPEKKRRDLHDKAQKIVKDSQRMAKSGDPVTRARFTKEFRRIVKKLFDVASATVGIEVCALIVYETDDGKTKVARELSAGIRGFSNSSELAGSMGALKDFLEAMGDPTENVIPSPRVYPNLTKGGYPCLPNFEGWSLRRMRKLMRDFIKAIFKFQGGVGRMIWTEVKASRDYYLDTRRLPKVPGLVWGDPGHLTLPMVRIWLDFFLACLSNAIPPEETFQFLRVPAGSAPIHPSDSEETGREQVERDGKLVYILVFENQVTKCHRVGGMSYDSRAIDYANFVSFGSDHPNAASAAPQHWLHLPSAGPNIPEEVFFGTELDRLTNWASLAPEPAKARVLLVIEVANTYQKHLPASHPLGVWLYEGAIPLVLPRSPQEASSWVYLFWLPPDFYRPPGLAPFEGTLYGFEVFQDGMRESEVILHKPSGTFYGGLTGIFSVLCPLIRIYLNCLAARGELQPPEDIPPGYDLTRFPVSEHDRIVSWIDKWIAIIKKHTNVLSVTSAERKRGLSTSCVRPSSQGSDSEASHDSDIDHDSETETDGPNRAITPTTPPHSLPFPSASTSNPDLLGPSNPVAGPSKPAARPSKPAARPSKSAAGPSTQSKGKEPMRRRFADDDDESDDEDPEFDYDTMDITSQDSDSSDDEEAWARFDERLLDDDIFPSSDPMGLCERYGFDVEVELPFHAICEPYQGVLSEDLWSPNHTKPLFGGFPELLPYKHPRISRVDTLIRHLIVLATEANKAKKRWDVYHRGNPQFIPEPCAINQEEVSGLPTSIQPLLQLLLNRIVIWLRAKAMAPYVIAHFTAMSYLIRESIHLFATAERFLDKDDFSSSEYIPEDIFNQVHKSKLQIIEIGFIVSELREWYELSTKFKEKLRGNWIISTIPPLGEIVNIAEGTLEWVKATDGLVLRLAGERLQSWNNLFDIPFPPAERGLNFMFGCPSTAEVPEGLEDALKKARTMSPSLSVLNGEIESTLSVETALHGLWENATQQSRGKRAASDSAPTAALESASTMDLDTTPDPTPDPPAGPSTQNATEAQNGIEGEQTMDLDERKSSTPPPPPRCRPKVKPRRIESPQPDPVVEPDPVGVPIVDVPKPVVVPLEADAEPPGVPTVVSPLLSPATSSAQQGGSGSKTRSQTKAQRPPRPSPPQGEAEIQATQNRKRKPVQEAADISQTRPKRTSRRLQDKTDVTNADLGTEEEQGTRRMRTRSGHKK